MEQVKILGTQNCLYFIVGTRDSMAGESRREKLNVPLFEQVKGCLRHFQHHQEAENKKRSRHKSDRCKPSLKLLENMLRAGRVS